MSSLSIEMKGLKRETEAKLGDLLYGTLFTGAPGHPSAIYMKCCKKVSVGMSLTWSRDYCVALNLKSATIREISADAIVTVLEGTSTVQKALACKYTKS